MNKIKIAVVGYGNIGKYAVEAVLASPDMELAGVVRRDGSNGVPKELQGVPVADDVKKLGKVDVALLCKPTRQILEIAKEYLDQGICTVDSYDIHQSIFEVTQELEEVCKKNNVVSIVSVGWDPGSDSVIRALMEACAPKGVTYTNFGPGMSMGHTVAAKSIPGVADALSMTIPLGAGVHRRMVYVQLVEGVEFENVVGAIKSDPYFAKDDTHVMQVDDVKNLVDKGHGVYMIRKGVSGVTDNQIFEYNMKINNPALTSQIMVACARAAIKQKPGAYTMIELPLIDLLYGDRESLIKKLV